MLPGSRKCNRVTLIQGSFSPRQSLNSGSVSMVSSVSLWPLLVMYDIPPGPSRQLVSKPALAG